MSKLIPDQDLYLTKIQELHKHPRKSLDVTICTGSSQLDKGSIISYENSLAPPKESHVDSLWLIIQNSGELNTLLQYLIRGQFSLLKMSKNGSAFLSSKSKNLNVITMPDGMSTGGGKEFNFGLETNNPLRIADILDESIVNHSEFLAKLSDKRVNTLIATTGVTSTIIKYLIVSDVLQLNIHPNLNIISSEYPLWLMSRLNHSATYDVALKIAIDVADPMFSGKMIHIINRLKHPIPVNIGQSADCYLGEVLLNYGMNVLLKNKKALYIGYDFSDILAKLNRLNKHHPSGGTLALTDFEIIHRDKINDAIFSVEEDWITQQTEIQIRDALKIVFTPREINEKKPRDIIKIVFSYFFVPESIYLSLNDNAKIHIADKVMTGLQRYGFTEIDGVYPLIFPLPDSYHVGVFFTSFIGDKIGTLAAILSRSGIHHPATKIKGIFTEDGRRSNPIDSLVKSKFWPAQQYFREAIEVTKRITRQTGLFTTLPETIEYLLSIIPGVPKREKIGGEIINVHE